MKLIPVPYIDQSAAGAYTGCESVTAVMLLQYLGYPVRLFDFIDTCLEKESFERRGDKLYGGDPREVFCGDPRDPEAMGCYAPVLIRAMEKVAGDRFALRDETGTGLEALCRRYIDREMPVPVWATIDMKPYLPGPDWYLKKDGSRFSWRSNEHCLLLVGYDEKHYIFNDPWQGNGLVAHPKTLAEARHREQYSQAIGLAPKENV